ncbi:hypothetical protein LQT97_24115 [Brucella pseudogrignonensis]|uniref:hypothetical protein n=1 Tax=Brucella pseudogrignonensis TaxID=419475 RepID=UPI001E4DA63B|nr:hypothetical protein [Brucella pseudogrignonensis]MCD4514320.1 hypothetical protein [Brucella pseudogrignonensis]
MDIYTEQRAMLARMVRTPDETYHRIGIIRRQFGKSAERIIAFRNLTNCTGDRQ